MLALKDEMVLNVDGILHVDPALGLRERAQSFVASRQWTTPSVFYGDQEEPDFSQDSPAWSMCFCLGLDHAMKTKADWFADVAALLEFVRTVALDTRCEFNVEFRLKSRLQWAWPNSAS